MILSCAPWLPRVCDPFPVSPRRIFEARLPRARSPGTNHTTSTTNRLYHPHFPVLINPNLENNPPPFNFYLPSFQQPTSPRSKARRVKVAKMADHPPAKSQLFEACRIAFVPSKSMSSSTIVDWKAQITENGAEVLEPDRKGRIRMAQCTHVVSNTIDFEQFSEAQAMMVPVVRPDWIKTSLARGKLAQLRPYSPDPRMIFSDVILTCADIPSTDKEAICGAVMALGGMESKDLAKQTTHICALSMDHPKCKEATARKLKAKVVLPHWLDDCFRLGKRIDETPYLLPDPEILRARPEDPVKIPDSQQLEGATSAIPTGPYQVEGGEKLIVFNQRKVMLSDDLPISPSLRDTLTKKITKGDGEIVTRVEDCSMFICQYRDGDQYVLASQLGKEVGNLAWLFHMIVYNEWTDPLRRLLHYPIPRHGIPGFKDLRITLSNYGGDARTYLENLITAAGATYTRTMKAENTHLITARMHSEKCEAAKDWNIEIVNHLWIEESYAACKALALNNPKFTHFPPRTNLGEVIGQVSFKESVLREMYYPGGEEVMDAAAKKKKKILAAAEENALMVGLENDFNVMQDSFMADATAPKSARSARKTRAAAAPSMGTFATPAKGRHVRSGKENDTPSVTSSVSRSAKAQALSRLSDMAPDLALYEKEKKRVTKDGIWGGKRAADQIDRERSGKSSSPARTDEDEDEEDEEEAGAKKRPAKRQRLSLPEVDMRVCLTGYKKWVGNAKQEEADRKVLRTLGIHIVTDNQPCDYLAAPRVVRTMKFLKCLARGAELINSTFIDACLETGERADVNEHLLVDKENEAKFGIKMSVAVGRARSNRGRLLWNVPVYCTEHIKNGTEAFKAIAEANGAIFKVYRARGGATIKPTTAEEDGGAPPEPVYLLSGITPAEKLLWAKFEDMAMKGHMEPRIVNPDWLLDVAMRQELTFDKRYLVTGKTGGGGDS
ncbi:BRCT-containing protein 1 [Podospora fimiseda]|uniref:BRCT-containing protein 1 n=1 Tax=Podospora fimiseda TaxID=252190 RepID=A0AAN7H8Y8_9PEZI|nr:BRCT-containing protein 1 [Podospora fimiseda]